MIKQSDIILDRRRTGKTTELIIRSHDEQIPIVTFNHRSVDIIKNQAKELGFDIPDPISPYSLETDSIENFGDARPVLVDEMVTIFENMFNVKVEGFVASVDMD